MRRQPRPGKLPVPLDGYLGHIEFLSDFILRQSAEETQFGHARGARVRFFQFDQRLIDDQQIVAGTARCFRRLCVCELPSAPLDISPPGREALSNSPPWFRDSAFEPRP